jgi:cytochrome P450
MFDSSVRNRYRRKPSARLAARLPARPKLPTCAGSQKVARSDCAGGRDAAMTRTASLSLDQIRLDDPDFYQGDTDEAFALLRREAPVFWYEPGGFWVLSKHADVQDVSRRPEQFSSVYGLQIAHKYLGDRMAGEPLAPEYERAVGNTLPRPAEVRRVLLNRAMAEQEAEQPLMSDPPRHGPLRALLFKAAFTPRIVRQLEPWVRTVVNELLDQITFGETADLVTAVAESVPTYVVAHLLGIPAEDREHFKRWAIAASASAEILDEAGEASRRQQLAELYSYLEDKFEEHRQHPRDDLMTRLLDARLDDAPLTRGTLLSFAMSVLAAGSETTINLIAGAARSLAEHPDQRRLLVEQPELLGGAADEFLRWVTPVISFARTATTQARIADQVVEAGSYVLMLYASANRDEAVWADPAVFDVTRQPDPMHLSFGYGEHACLGQHLARLEIRVTFEELLRRFPDYELAGPARRRRSMFMKAIESMPTCFR